MNKWSVRIVGVFMILVFMWIFLQLYKQLKEMQGYQQGNPPAATST